MPSQKEVKNERLPKVARGHISVTKRDLISAMHKLVRKSQVATAESAGRTEELKKLLEKIKKAPADSGELTALVLEALQIVTGINSLAHLTLHRFATSRDKKAG